MTEKTPNKCKVCGAINQEKSCGISGRIYVDAGNIIMGVMPPCPLTDTSSFIPVDGFFLSGVTSNDVGSMIPMMDRKEHDLAVNYGEFLGVCGKDLRESGLWEDDETDSGIEV